MSDDPTIAYAVSIALACLLWRLGYVCGRDVARGEMRGK